ncbi:MAG: SDR family oxidoreductase [Caldilineaceae bacterium]|nr:SDR family oxidoreductase [Caldilineaceae bacterium]
MTNLHSLAGKTSVITGSTQGLGEATARLFVARGCREIIITGRNRSRGEAVAADLAADGCRAVFIQADLTDAEACRRIIGAADEHFGKLDILVNCAALTERGTIWDASPDLFDRMMAVNVRAPFFLMQESVKLMQRDNVKGAIVNVSSISAYGSVPMLSVYAASKAALNVLTKNVAYSVMRRRIRVNALNLGWMDTPGEETIQRRYHTDDPDWLAAAEETRPFGRLLKPAEVARTIAFLASDESGMMTGSIVDFDQSVAGAGPPPVPPPMETWDVVEGIRYE